MEGRRLMPYILYPMTLLSAILQRCDLAIFKEGLQGTRRKEGLKVFPLFRKGTVYKRSNTSEFTIFLYLSCGCTGTHIRSSTRITHP